MTEESPTPQEQTALMRRRAQITARNRVMGLCLGGLVVLLFAVSIIKTGGG